MSSGSRWIGLCGVVGYDSVTVTASQPSSSLTKYFCRSRFVDRYLRSRSELSNGFLQNN